MNTRTELINAIIQRQQYKSYLEIGAGVGANLEQVQCEKKRGIDPAYLAPSIQRITSDDFFKLLDQHASETMFDLVFIDGDHHHDQVWRDIDNSLKRLNPGGMLVIHDLLPPNQECELGGKCGSGWRAFAMFRKFPELDGIVLNMDHGCGLVRKTRNPSVCWVSRTMDEMTWEDFMTHQHDWLRVYEPRFLGAWLGEGDDK